MSARVDVLVVDAEAESRAELTRQIGLLGHDPRTAGSAVEAVEAIARRTPDLVLCDATLPGCPGIELLRFLRDQGDEATVIMMIADGSIGTAVAALRAGALDCVAKPVSSLALVEMLRGASERKETAALLADDASPRSPTAAIVGISREMADIRRLCRTIAATEASAVITGESGTGKEVVARAIHAASARADRPFVAVNAAAMPDGLIESELFGHERGAFTGAVRERIGCFELANGGSILLDEIAEMPLPLQPKLLRVLEDRRARRVGGGREIQFNVRVLAATNRPLLEAMRSGAFREDLFYRLNVFEIEIPPLRQRMEDLRPLASSFIRQLNAAHALSVVAMDDEVWRLLESHSWPGNVRELRNVIERCVLMARRGAIRREHLPARLRAGGGAGSPVIAVPATATLQDVERRLILAALERVGQNKAEAARQLGVDVKTVRNKLRGYRTGS